MFKPSRFRVMSSSSSSSRAASSSSSAESLSSSAQSSSSSRQTSSSSSIVSSSSSFPAQPSSSSSGAEPEIVWDIASEHPVDSSNSNVLPGDQIGLRLKCNGNPTNINWDIPNTIFEFYHTPNTGPAELKKVEELTSQTVLFRWSDVPNPGGSGTRTVTVSFEIDGVPGSVSVRNAPSENNLASSWSESRIQPIWIDTMQAQKFVEVNCPPPCPIN